MTDAAVEEIDSDYAAALATRANRFMLEHGVAPTPNNFAVWFGYAQGNPPELKRVIDVLIANRKRFDAVACRELYLKYLAPGRGAGTGGDTPDQLKSIMTEARRFLTEAISDNRSQMQTIGDVAERAERGIEPRSLVECLMTELGRAASRASELEANLSDTSRELDVIRESLNRAEQRANTDALTGLPNRRAFDEFLRASQVSAMETGEALSLLMVDIDHFKQINDGFGHGVGDQVLRFIAGVLRERLRENDLPARYGGEELIAVLPGVELAACEAIAERVRRAVADCKITRRSTGEPLPVVTISIGIAQFRPGESGAQLVERCDAALYSAKRSGRNRTAREEALEDCSAA